MLVSTSTVLYEQCTRWCHDSIIYRCVSRKGTRRGRREEAIWRRLGGQPWPGSVPLRRRRRGGVLEADDDDEVAGWKRHYYQLAQHTCRNWRTMWGQRNRDAARAFSQKKEDETPADACMLATVIFVACKVLNKPQLDGCAVMERSSNIGELPSQGVWKYIVNTSTSDDTAHTSYKRK